MTAKTIAQLKAEIQAGHILPAQYLYDVIDSVQGVIPINAKDYGAMGDGATDDTTALQNALAAAIAAGVTLYLPSGDYLVSATPFTLNAVSNVRICGDGIDETTIKLSGNISAIDVSGVSAGITIDHMTIVHTAAATSGYGIRVIGTVGTHSNDVLIHAVRLQNIPFPIYLQYVDRVEIRSVRYVQSVAQGTVGSAIYFQGVISARLRDVMMTVTTGTIGVDGIRLDSDCDTIVADGVELSHAAGYGVRLMNSLGGGSTGPRLTRIHNVHVESCVTGGIIVADGRDVRIEHCHSAVNSGIGFVVTGGASVVLSDCLSLQNNSHGFYVSGGSGVAFVHCTASNNSQSADNTFAGIFVANTASDVRIVGNRSGNFILSLVNRQQYGISLVAGCDFIVCIGNNTQTNATGGLFDGCTGTKAVANNI